MSGGAEDPFEASAGWRDSLSYARRTWWLVWSNSPGLILWIAVLTVCVALLPPAALYVSKLVIDGVLQAVESGAPADRDLALVWVSVEAVILAALLALRRLLSFEKTRLHAELGFAANHAIITQSARLGLEQIEHAQIQQQIVIAKQFATSRPYSFINRGFDSAQHSITIISVVALLWAFSPWLLVFMLGGALPLFIGNWRFADTAYHFYKGRTPQVRERSYLESLVSGDATSRERLHYGFGPRILARYEAMFWSLYRDDLQLKTRHALYGALLAVVSSAVFLGAKLWIVWVAILGTISLGQMTMFAGLVKQGQASITALLSAFQGVREDVLYLQTLYAFLDLPVPQDYPETRAGPLPGDGLRFENVSFSYPNAPRPALDGVSFHLKPGESLGIVGVNGAGKTTLVKLALGLYRPQAGQVKLDGLELDRWSRDALRARFGVLFQPSTNYKLTARENITAGVGMSDMAEEAVLNAARQGLALDVISDLPLGLDTRLSRRHIDGVELSGGQWKRLGLARAYANTQSDILILDEPTAALDPAAEAELIGQPRQGKSLVIISHRLSNLRPADQILMLAGGRVIEQGRHDDLIAQGGAYAEMFTIQAEAYA